MPLLPHPLPSLPSSLPSPTPNGSPSPGSWGPIDLTAPINHRTTVSG
jgi:hypothetical protein